MGLLRAWPGLCLNTTIGGDGYAVLCPAPFSNVKWTHFKGTPIGQGLLYELIISTNLPGVATASGKVGCTLNSLTKVRLASPEKGLQPPTYRPDPQLSA